MMTEELIRNYEKGFARMITAARAVQPEYLGKILAVVYLDTLSKAHKPAEKLSARQRFVIFVRECSDWAECDYVSLPALASRSQHSVTLSGNPMIGDLLKRLSNWPLASLPLVRNGDCPLPDNGERQPSEVTRVLRACTHSELLYDLRNYLVHEARDPAFSFGVSQEPHYIQYGGAGFDNAAWKLCYPPEFLYKLVERSLTRLVELLRTQDRDPYESYPSAEVWPSS